MGVLDMIQAKSMPTVGKSFRIVEHFQTAIIQCQCDTKTILVLVDRGNIKVCAACGRGFAIANPSSITVGQVRPDDAPIALA